MLTFQTYPTDKYVNFLRFPSYEDYGTYKKTDYDDLDEENLEVEETLEVEEMSNMSSSLEGKKKLGGKKSYKDIIWQWDDAAWIMCAVLMTFTMQVILI